mgnify:CR=1 FL=1
MSHAGYLQASGHDSGPERIPRVDEVADSTSIRELNSIVLQLIARALQAELPNVQETFRQIAARDDDPVLWSMLAELALVVEDYETAVTSGKRAMSAS